MQTLTEEHLVVDHPKSESMQSGTQTFSSGGTLTHTKMESACNTNSNHQRCHGAIARLNPFTASKSAQQVQQQIFDRFKDTKQMLLFYNNIQ